MPAKKSAAAAELARTQEQLAAAQSRIAELEGFLANTRSLPLDQLPLDFYRHTLDNLLESCQIIGFDWRYLYLNDAAVKAGRITREEMLGYTVMEKYPGIESTEMFAAMRKCMDERTPQDAEFDFTFVDQSKESFEFKIQPVPEGIFILAINITERKRADEQIRKLNRTLAVLSDINQAIVRVRDIPKLLQRVCTIAVEKGAFHMAWIGLLNPQTRQIMPMGHAGIADNYVKNLNITVDQGEYGTGPSAIALRSGQRVIIDDIEDNPIMQPWREDARQLGYRSSAALPILVNGEVQGIFHLYATEPNFFDPPEIRLLDEMVDDIAFAMEFAEQEAQRRQAGETQRRYAQRLEVLHHIDQDLVQGRSVEELIRGTIKHLRQIIPCQQANIILIDHAANEGLIYAVDYSQKSAYAEGIRYPLPPDAFEGYDARHLRIYDDIRLEPETNERAKRLASEGMISGLSAFLMDQDTPIASLSLLADKANFFTPEYQEIAVEIANQLAIAIKQMRLSESLEQRVAERTIELTDSRRRVEAILNSSTDGIILAYLNAGIQQTNDTFNILFACEPNDYFGKPLTSLVSTEDQEAVTQLMYSVAADRKGRTVEVRARVKDDRLFDAEIGISPMQISETGETGFVCTVHDITDRKQLLTELERQRTFLRDVIDVSPSMMFVKDYDGRFILANAMVAKIYNTTVDDLLGKSDADFNASLEEAARFLEADRRVITTGETLIVEEPVTSANGITHWFQTIKVPILGVDGKSKYVLGVSTDITERRKSEARLQEALQREKELGELKSRFVSMASHEFRTPLATILAATETLSAYRKKMDDSQIDQRLSKIQVQVEHLKNVIDDVLQLAQIQAQKVVFSPVVMDLDAMCRSVLDEFQSNPNFKHDLVYTCDPKLRSTYLDKRLMRQIINNLMSNAVKYSPAGKTIQISLEEKDGSLIFKIQDQGIGIPEADLKHLFEPFHRAGNVGTISGTGLGLVITKESVELHGGTIAVESKVGVGTTFTVVIPLVQG